MTSKTHNVRMKYGVGSLVGAGAGSVTNDKMRTVIGLKLAKKNPNNVLLPLKVPRYVPYTEKRFKKTSKKRKSKP